jgi:hypothetical protein
MECTTLLACELPLPLRYTGLLPSLQQVAELLQLREQSLREGWGRSPSASEPVLSIACVGPRAGTLSSARR